MKGTEDRIREALTARAGVPVVGPLPNRAQRRVRTRQVGLAAVLTSVAAAVLAFAVVAYGTVGGSTPKPTSTFDPAADGYASPLEDVPPGWPAVDIGDPADAFIPKSHDVSEVSVGPVVLASGTVDGSRFTLFAYTEERQGVDKACLGFVGFAAPGARTNTAPTFDTCVDATGPPNNGDITFVGTHSDARPDLTANFGFVSGRVDTIYVWGGGRLGMFQIPTLSGLDGWNVAPFLFVPAPNAGPLEVNARVRGGALTLARADICVGSATPGTCRTTVVQEFPLTSPVDAPVPLEPGEWPTVTYGGDFEPYVDHEVSAAGVADPGVVGQKTVIAYGTVQAAPWSLVAYNARFVGAPDGVSPSSELSINGGGGGTSLYGTTPWSPNDLAVGYGWGSREPFVHLAGVVTERVDRVVLDVSNGTRRDLALIDGPDGVNARYFVAFLPLDTTGRVIAVDYAGREVQESCIRDRSGNPPVGMPCIE